MGFQTLEKKKFGYAENLNCQIKTATILDHLTVTSPYVDLRLLKGLRRDLSPLVPFPPIPICTLRKPKNLTFYTVKNYLPYIIGRDNIPFLPK